MNILIDKLPTDYEGLKINTNFRSFLLFELLMQDNQIDDNEKILMAIDLFFKERPQDLKKAIEGILWFYRGGKSEKSNKTGNNSRVKKIYSYEHDAELIYSAFMHDYSLDLNEIEYLHWWKFKSLFEALNDENKICQIMGYRAINLNEIKDKEQKKRYKKLQRQYALPDDRTEEQKEQDFANALW